MTDRLIKQIAVGSAGGPATLYALAHDGTLWKRFGHDAWRQLDGLPPVEDDTATVELHTGDPYHYEDGTPKEAADAPEDRLPDTCWLQGVGQVEFERWPSLGRGEYAAFRVTESGKELLGCVRRSDEHDNRWYWKPETASYGASDEPWQNDSPNGDLMSGALRMLFEASLRISERCGKKDPEETVDSQGDYEPLAWMERPLPHARKAELVPTRGEPNTFHVLITGHGFGHEGELIGRVRLRIDNLSTKPAAEWVGLPQWVGGDKDLPAEWHHAPTLGAAAEQLYMAWTRQVEGTVINTA